MNSISLHNLLRGCLYFIDVFSWNIWYAQNSALTSQPLEREAYPRVGHSNLLPYVHVSCILMELYAGNAIDVGHAKTPKPSLRARGMLRGELLAARERLYTIAPCPLAEDSSPQLYEDLDT